MAYRRVALDAVGGFDERFPRAFREGAELAYRVRAARWQLRRGRRTVTHPVRAESRWISVRAQRGNADDALLRRLYGPRWRTVLDVPPGRRDLAEMTAMVVTSAVIPIAAVGHWVRGWWRWRDTRPLADAGAVTAGHVSSPVITETPRP